MDRSPFAEIATKYGVKVDFNPFIKVEGVSSKEFRQQRVDFLAHTAVIFTSRTTIDNFFRICEECRITIPETMKYFCITEAIALYLQKYIVYRKRKIFFGKSTFAELMDVILKHKEEKFVIPLSEPHKPEIPKMLDKSKVKYSKVILARTVSTDVSAIDLKKYDLLVFYSPSEITSLISNFENLPENAKIAIFGASTAKSAVEAGLKVSVVAPTKEVPSMTMAIDNFIAKYNNGETVDTAADLKQMIASLATAIPKMADAKKKSTTAKKSVKAKATSAAKAVPAVQKKKSSVAVTK